MFYIVFGLLFLLLIVFAVMASKHWHWINTVFLILTFIAGTAAATGMAKVFYKRSKAVAALNSIQEKTVAARRNLRVAIQGTADDIGYGKDSLRALSNELNLMLMGRGRVWTGGDVAANDGAWNFTLPQPMENVDPETLTKLQQMEVHVFRNAIIKNRPYPVSYVGQFRIRDVSAAGFVMEAVRIIDKAEAATPSATWTVYEKMPLDRRGTFKDAYAIFAEEKGIDPESLSIDQFRNILETQFFPAEKFPFEKNSAQYEQLIDRYAFDGRSLGQIENWVEEKINNGTRFSGRFEPSKEEVFVKYRFDKPSREYKVDASSGSLETEGSFTPLGLAVARDIHLGADVKFDTDDEVLIDQVTAEGYQRGETNVPPFPSTEAVTEIDRIYVRQNRDYPFLFASMANRGVVIAETLADRKKDNALHDNQISKDVEQQLQERQRLQSDLEFDNQNLEADREAVTSLEAKRQQQVEAMVTKIEQLQKQQEKLRRELGEVSRKIEPVLIQGASAGGSESFTTARRASATSNSLPPIVRPDDARVRQFRN